MEKNLLRKSIAIVAVQFIFIILGGLLSAFVYLNTDPFQREIPVYFVIDRFATIISLFLAAILLYFILFKQTEPEEFMTVNQIVQSFLFYWILMVILRFLGGFLVIGLFMNSYGAISNDFSIFLLYCGESLFPYLSFFSADPLDLFHPSYLFFLTTFVLNDGILLYTFFLGLNIIFSSKNQTMNSPGSVLSLIVRSFMVFLVYWVIYLFSIVLLFNLFNIFFSVLVEQQYDHYFALISAIPPLITTITLFPTVLIAVRFIYSAQHMSLLSHDYNAQRAILMLFVVVNLLSLEVSFFFETLYPISGALSSTFTSVLLSIFLNLPLAVQSSFLLFTLIVLYISHKNLGLYGEAQPDTDLLYMTPEEQNKKKSEQQDDTKT